MDLTIYDIIQGAIVSDKAYKLNTGQNKLVLKVHPKSNKPLVKQAIEQLFKVKVEKVNIVSRKGKRRRVNRVQTTQGPLVKKAYVTLAEGYSLNLFGQGAETTPAGEQG